MIDGIECAIMGTITRDAEIKTVKASGRPFLSLGITTGKDEKQQYLSVMAWRETFTDLAPHLTKGVRVYIEGRLELRHWQGTDGPQHGLSVSASVIQPMGLIGERKPKAPRAAKKAAGAGRAGGAGQVDSQRPIGAGEAGRPFDDSISDLF
jgi:single-stranded DNA-binding protein